MKKILLISSLLTTAPSIFSQSVTSPTIPEAGVYYEVGIVDNTISFSNEGDWDFSSISTTSKATIHIAPINTSSQASNYPNATHVKYEDGNQFFLGFSNTEYTFHGEISVLTSSYENSLVLNPYPFNVGDEHTDFEKEVPFTVPNGPPYLIRMTVQLLKLYPVERLQCQTIPFIIMLCLCVQEELGQIVKLVLHLV